MKRIQLRRMLSIITRIIIAFSLLNLPSSATGLIDQQVTDQQVLGSPATLDEVVRTQVRDQRPGRDRGYGNYSWTSHCSDHDCPVSENASV